jgi:hypothetical protein
MQRLIDQTSDEPPKEKDEKPSTPPTAEKPKVDAPAKDAKTAAPPAPAAPEGGGLKVRRDRLKRPELPLVTPPTAEPAKTAAIEEKPDPQWEAGLDEEQREVLTDAREAEKLFPEKHKGLAARTAKFLRDDAAFKAKPDFDDQSPEYQQFLAKSQPKLSRAEIRQLEETRLTSKWSQTHKAELGELKHKLFVRDAEPKIEEEGRRVFNELARTALPDEITQALATNRKEAESTYKLELEIANETLGFIAEEMKEFERLSVKDPETGRYLATPVDDPNHPKYAQHQRLGVMVGNVCEEFKKSAPDDQQVRGGKFFVTRDEWGSIRPDQRHRFWTFTNKEISQRALNATKGFLANQIAKRRSAIEGYGYARPTKAAAPAPVTQFKPNTEPPTPINTPKTPGPATMPGGGDTFAEVDARAKSIAQRLGRE